MFEGLRQAVQQAAARSPEQIAGEQNQKPDKQGFEAVAADHRYCDMRIAHEKRKNGQQNGKEERELRWRGQACATDWP
jgi:hypothetical protein